MPKYKFLLQVEVNVESEFTYLKTREKMLENVDKLLPAKFPKNNPFNCLRLRALGSKFIKLERTF